MLNRLQVENYQSLEKADVELKPLTVIVGANRAGKSALLRALTSLITNKTGSGFITHGKPSATVRVYLDNDIVVEWRKTKTSAEYTITHGQESEKLTKLAGAVPPQVESALNIRGIEVDANLTLWPQIHRQGQYAFLVDLSPGAAARAVAKLTRLDVVVKAQQLSKKAETRISDLLKGEAAKRDQALEELKEFSDLEERAADLAKINKKKLALDTLISKLEGVEIADTDLQYARAYLSNPRLDTTELRGLLATINQLEKITVPVIPATIETGTLMQDIQRLETISRIENDLEHTVETCAQLWSMLDKLDVLSEETHALLQEYNGTVCPVCGGIIEITVSN